MKACLSSAFICSLGLLSLIVQESTAIRIPVKPRNDLTSRIKSKLNLKQLDAASGSDDLSNIGNIRYTTNISINGVEVHVALDTGSTDLWVQPPGGIGTFNDTKIPISLLYGDGTYGINGTIGVAPFEFGPYRIERQAFVNAVTGNIGAIQDIGIHGLLGLGFDQPYGSPIINALQEHYHSSNVPWGASVLNNTFAQNPLQPNFVAFDLSRSDDLESSGDGSFTIGEYDPDYVDVAKTPKLPKYPPPPVGYRWSVQFNDIQVNEKSIKVTSGVKGVPKGKGVALLDTGNPSGSFPPYLVDAIYSGIDGAVKWDGNGNQWIVPCKSDSLPSVTFNFGGQIIPIHPLDLTDITEIPIQDKNYTLCLSSFTADDTITVDEFDIALGDTFLRNVYSLYDFGDTLPDGTTSDAYIQLLAKTDLSKAMTDYVSSRDNALENAAPEIAPSDFLKQYQASVPEDNNADAALTNGTANEDNSSNDSNLIAKYGPVIIGLLAVNIVIGLVLVILGVIQYVRRGASSSARVINPQYVPVKTKIAESNVAGHYQMPYGE